jgi:hypothetical protein
MVCLYGIHHQNDAGADNFSLTMNRSAMNNCMGKMVQCGESKFKATKICISHVNGCIVNSCLSKHCNVTEVAKFQRIGGTSTCAGKATGTGKQAGIGRIGRRIRSEITWN